VQATVPAAHSLETRDSVHGFPEGTRQVVARMSCVLADEVLAWHTLNHFRYFDSILRLSP